MRRLNPFGLMAALENEDVTITPDSAAKPDETTKPDDAAAAAAAATDTTTTAATTDVNSTTASTADTTTTDAEPVPAEDIGENAESLETDLIDVAEDQGAADADEANLDEAVETVDTLEEVDEALADAIEAGGLNKEGADVVATAIECLFDRVGYRIPGERLVALEKFTGTSTALEALEDTRKKVAEGAKKIWESIIAAIKKSIVWVAERLSAVFGSAEKLGQRAQSLREKASALKGKTASGKPKLENSRLVSALHLGGKVDGVQAAKILEEASKGVAQPRGHLLEALVKVIEDEDQGSSLSEIFEQATLSMGKTEKVDSQNNEGLELKTGFNVFRSPELPGGKALVGYFADADAGGDMKAMADRVGQVSITLREGWPARKEQRVADIDALTAEQCLEVAQHIDATATHLLALKAEAAKNVNQKNRAIRALEKFSKQPADSETEARNLVAKLGLLITRLVDNPITGFSAYAVYTGKSCLDYVEESLKQYSSKAEPKAEPKEEKKEEAAAA
jgi:hypothetical protein